MARRPPPGRCVHCLKRCAALTWDHGIPISWYPDGHSGPKAKAPSCRACQDRLQKVERAVLLPLAICLDPNDPLARGVPQAVMRSIDPNQAAKPGMTPSQIQREQRARQKRREEVLSRLFTVESGGGALPGFGQEYAPGSNTAILGPHVDEIKIVGDKFTRVAVWVMRNRQFVERDYTVATHVVDISDVPEVEDLVRGGDALDIFPGIRLTIRSASDEERTHLCLFELWGRLKIFTSVVPRSAE